VGFPLLSLTRVYNTLVDAVIIGARTILLHRFVEIRDCEYWGGVREELGKLDAIERLCKFDLIIQNNKYQDAQLR
jgi:hypothetical protein